MKKNNKSIKHFDIKAIQNPGFLKSLSYAELNVLSDDIREYIIDVVSHSGGHLSSNLGVVEASIALCRCFDAKSDKIIFDVGHQCYAYKILTGRHLENFREKGGISGFQKMEESPYDCYSAGHSSTSISAAAGFAYARDLKNEHYHVVSFIGDASLTNGLAFEGLNASNENKHKMIIVVNDNNMSISKPVGALSKMFRKISFSKVYIVAKKGYRKLFLWNRLGRKILKISSSFKTFIKSKLIRMNFFDLLGYNTIGPIDGHNIKRLEKAFELAKKSNKSAVILIKTIKGKGFSYAENDTEGQWHGVGKFNAVTGELIASISRSWSNVYGDLLFNKMKENNKIITICAATELGSGLKEIFDTFKDRSIDVGIAEEHAITMASGLSISGFHPVISIYSTFMQRGYDQISHDIARLNCNATFLVDRSGLVGRDGETHQGIYDAQFLFGIPNVVIAMAANEEEATMLFDESFKAHGPFFIRYPREFSHAKLKDNVPLPFGKWKEIKKGENTAIISFGPVIEDLKGIINEKNINVTLINAVYQKPMDDECIDSLLSYQRIIIYDPYGVEQGFASVLSAKLLMKKYQGELIIKAIPDVFVKQGSIEEQREEFHIKVEDVIKLL